MRYIQNNYIKIKQLRENNHLSYRKIGEVFNISHERARQIYLQKKMFKKLGKKRINPVNEFIKLEVLKRDNFTCRVCGLKGYWRDNNIIVHHLDHSGLLEEPNNNIENLISICSKCHRSYHARYLHNNTIKLILLPIKKHIIKKNILYIL